MAASLMRAVPHAIEQDSTLIAVIEMSQSRWLVAATVRAFSDSLSRSSMYNESALLKVLHRSANEAGRSWACDRACGQLVGLDATTMSNHWLRARDVEASLSIRRRRGVARASTR